MVELIEKAREKTEKLREKTEKLREKTEKAREKTEKLIENATETLKEVEKLSFAENFALSGCAAVISKTAAAPIERIKLLIQNQDEMIKQVKLLIFMTRSLYVSFYDLKFQKRLKTDLKSAETPRRSK